MNRLDVLGSNTIIKSIYGGYNLEIFNQEPFGRVSVTVCDIEELRYTIQKVQQKSREALLSNRFS